MAATFRVLAQLYPVAGTETSLYTCSVNSTVISSLIICNNSDSNDNVSVRINVGGAINSNNQLLFSNTEVLARGVLDLTAGLTLANTDVMKVTSFNGVCAFQLFGQENN